MSRRLLTIAAACSALALPATASAHTGIKRYSPKPGATASKHRKYVKVTFEARVTDANLTVSRKGSKVSRGSGSLVHKGRQARARLTTHRAGRYTASLRWLSADGHIQTKSWSFRLR
jgi:methionine-rich copper-binding protein CopC